MPHEKFNYVDYALTLGMLEVYKNHPKLLQSLISKMQTTTNKTYNLFVFANEYPEINGIYDSVFSTRFSNFADYGNNWKNFVEANYKYDTSYVPFVTFANLGSIDYSLPAYAAGPFEINEEKFTDFDDDLPMWINTGESSMLFTTVNEYKASIITNPILLTTNAFTGYETVSITPVPGNPPVVPVNPMSCGYYNPPTPHIHESITHKKFKIDYRYENTGRSEYSFCYAAAKTYVLPNNMWGNYGGNIITESKKVESDMIGTMIDFNFDVFYPTYYNTSFCIDINMLTNSHLYDKNFIVAAWENDWYASKKFLFTVTAYGVEEKIRSKRKFKSEWYFWDPKDNNSYSFIDRNYTPNSTYINQNKGEVQLLRHY